MILTYCLTRITPDHCEHHFDCLLVMLAESNDAVLLRLSLLSFSSAVLSITILPSRGE